MRILHVLSTSLEGGAANGTYALHRALLERGIKSFIYTFNSNVSYLDDPTLIKPKNTFKNRLIAYCFFQLNRFLSGRFSRDGNMFSYDLMGYDFGLIEKINKGNYDIVHLHWINGGFLTVDKIKRISAKVVWTPRDYWIITGGCHYPVGCEKFNIGCGSCPMIKIKFDLTKQRWREKRELNSMKNLFFTAISENFHAVLSAAFPNKVEFIPNSVDLTDMQIVDRKEARIKLGLDPNRKYLCFGVNSFTDNYKGFDLLIEILKRIEFDCDLLLFGGTINSDRILFNGKIVDLGYTSSKSKLCEIFSASDLFLMPSIMETFGKTVVESLACGTPVVAWSSTGPASILNSLCPELIAKAGDIESFKDIIINVLSENLELDRFSCRSKALEFSNYNVALDYIGFYQRILKLH